MENNHPNKNVANLILNIEAGEDASSEEIDRLTRQLRNEIREMEVESVELVKEETIPEGAKSATAVTLGALAIAVLPTVIPKLIEFLQAWSMRGESRKVRIKTQVGDRSVEAEFSPTAMSQDELKDLVEMLTETVDSGGKA